MSQEGQEPDRSGASEREALMGIWETERSELGLLARAREGGSAVKPASLLEGEPIERLESPEEDGLEIFESEQLAPAPARRNAAAP